MATEPVTITDLDESQLSGENGSVYLFDWIGSVEKYVKASTQDVIKAKQADLVGSLIKIVQAPEPFPIPGRAIRNAVSRTLILLWTKGDSRTMFDGLQAFLKIVGDSKTVEKDSSKIAAFYCTGEILKFHGSQYMSFMVELSTITLKVYKSSSNNLLRYYAMMALRKGLATAKKAIADSVAKDLIKQAKYGLADKSFAIQRASAEVLLGMYTEDTIILVADVESILSLCTKSLENADQVTRKTLAKLVGHVLASTQIERSVVVAETKKDKKDKEKNKDDDDDETTTNQPAEVKKAAMTLNEMLNQLSNQFNKSNATKKTRVGIFDFYNALLVKLGSTFAETNYTQIVSHFMTEVVSSTRSLSTRYEVLHVRKLVGIILRDVIGVRMLSEQGQISALQELSKSFLKRWPAMMPNAVAPSPQILAITLKEVAGLLQQLGNAPPPVQDALSEPLVTLLSHPNHTVRVSSAWALRCFCYSTPLRLPKIIISVYDLLQRDITSLASPAAPSDIDLKTLGHAYGLAALIAVIPERPLYVSYDITSKVLDMATQLLKRSGEHDVKIASVEVEVAWTAIASLMSLGPNFARPHLPQLLVLWRNALPKPTVRDSGKGRSAAEWTFLLHVRDSALGAILCFLRHNNGLVTLDIARRIAMLLNNALSFFNTFLSQNVEDPADQPPQPGQDETPDLPMRQRASLMRSRIYQCFISLGFSTATESAQSALLQSSLSLFATAEGYSGSSMQAAIASSSGSFTNVWQSHDGYAYGVTSLELTDYGLIGGEESSGRAQDPLKRDAVEVAVNALLHRPIIRSCEHDTMALFPARRDSGETHLVEAPAATSSAVDSAIILFSQILSLQDLPSTVKSLTALLESIRSSKFEKNVGRKAAVTINASVAIVLALRHASLSNPKHARETFGNQQVTSVLSDFFKETLVDSDASLRAVTAESIGRLASFAGTAFLNAQIKDLVEQVVNNRDPLGRAGCAYAFGSIYDYVGGMAAGPLLKTTVNVLMSLSSDPHPTVHFWALTALSRVINAASLAYSQYVPGTLGTLLKIYSLESHEVEGGTLNNSNLSGDLPAYPLACQIIDGIINVLGPDLQESTRTRNLVLSLVSEFSFEDDDGIGAQAIQCIQHFLMFAPEYVSVPELVEQFRRHLSSSRRALKLASINALYQLVQKDALVMSRLGGDRLVEDLFGMLDDDPSVEGVRNVITSWLEQTVSHNPSAWIDLCQRIMSRTTASQQTNEVATQQAIRDDEGQSLSVGMTSTSGVPVLLTSRWRTQLFALQCLHQICTLVSRSGRREHLDIPFARARGLNTKGLLVTRVPDLIKMAFTASTAYVTEIRLEGLVVLQDVIQIFSKSPDPDYPEALLLEQHQAPITAALTPALSSDSTPEILASAVHASATFVGCGVVTDVNRMGRILKLLTTALEQSKGTGLLTLGDAAELSPNASAMLRISTLSAWAQLEIAGQHQKYLVGVLKPFISTLAALWIASLRDYASIKADSEFIQDPSLQALDSYTSLGKDVLLQYYITAWPIILRAVGDVMAAGEPAVLAAMDGQDSPATTNGTKPNREEPAAFFFVIFGLVFEALATSSTDMTLASSSRQSAVISALQALKYLVRSEYAGKALLDPTTFEEFISLCYRITMTESAATLVHLVPMIAAFTATCPPNETDDVFSASTPRAHCLRMCAFILRHATPSNRGPAIRGETADKVQMILLSFSVFHNVASSLSSDKREDVRALAVLLYSELLKDELSEVDLVSPTLPALKALLELPCHPKESSREKLSKTVHGLLSACLLNCDGMRGRQGAVSNRKVKSNLLASVLILTVIPSFVNVGRSAVDHAYGLIGQRLLDFDETTLTAAHCAKTLVTSASLPAAPGDVNAPGALLRATQCCRALLSPMIEYIVKTVPRVQEGNLAENHLAALGEVWKACSALLNSLTDAAQKARVIGVLLPVYILLIQGPTANPTATNVYSQTIQQVMSIASADPVAFREVTGRLDPAPKETLEVAVRKAVGAAGPARSSAPEQSSQPKIQLKSF